MPKKSEAEFPKIFSKKLSQEKIEKKDKELAGKG